MKFKPALLALLITAPAYGQDYQSLTSIDYVENEFGSFSFDTLAVSTVYYFDQKNTLGPLDEFDFINTTSFVTAAVFDSDFDDGVAIGGQYFNGNFKLGAYAVDEEGVNELVFGYLFSDNFIVNLHAQKDFNDDTEISFTSQYRIALEGNDYFGFTFSADEEFDFPSIGMKYFTALDGGSYLTAGFNYADSPVDSFYAANIGYFFTERTSLKFGYAENGSTSFDFKHFFDDNYALSVGYSEDDDNGFDEEAIRVSFSMQF